MLRAWKQLLQTNMCMFIDTFRLLTYEHTVLPVPTNEAANTAFTYEALTPGSSVSA